jgi:tRNA (guanine-N7-)-methyltransferase
MAHYQGRILTFGRRMGRALTPERQKLVEELLPQITINPSDLSQGWQIPPQELQLEIGFGRGDHLAVRAQNNPHIGYIGCEPFVNGVAHLLKLIKQHNIDNIRMWTDDARILLDQVPAHSLHKIFIFYPDPWPKLKHHNRRLITAEFLTHLSTKLVLGGELQIATDHKDYAQWILLRLQANSQFSSETTSDWRDFPADFVPTRYQMRAERLGIKSYFFSFSTNR